MFVIAAFRITVTTTKHVQCIHLETRSRSVSCFASRAVPFQLAVWATDALHAAVFHLAVGARVALCAVVFPLPVLTSLVCHHARLISSSHTPACALRLYSRCHDVQLKSPREKWWLSILGKIVSFHRNTRGGAVALPTPRRLSCWCCMTFGS